MATTQQTQQQGIEITSQALPSDGLSRFVRAGAWPAPDLARQSSLVFGRDPRTHRPRRGHGWLQYPPWRPCSEFGYAPACCRALPSLLQLPRQCTGRGDRVAGVRPAPSAEPNERPERQPHPRADMGFVAPTALVDRSAWLNSPHPEHACTAQPVVQSG
jgi:hypothetical protein